MTSARILWIEGKRAASPSFIPVLRRKGYDIKTVPTGRAALDKLDATAPHVVVVNAASMRTSGTRICSSLRSRIDGLPIILILNSDQSKPENVEASVVLSLPFTIRKLINRIIPLVPGDGKRVLKKGKVHLDLERLQVRCEGRETKITPRMSLLLQMLMKKPGEVIGRHDLFRRVWKTDYVEDTRTLDVHISWLRYAIEKNPRKPKFLKTIRGVGYRLDV